MYPGEGAAMFDTVEQYQNCEGLWNSRQREKFLVHDFKI